MPRGIVECPECAHVFEATHNAHIPIRDCAHCGQEFQGRHRKAIYCATNCAHAALAARRNTGRPTGRPKKDQR